MICILVGGFLEVASLPKVQLKKINHVVLQNNHYLYISMGDNGFDALHSTSSHTHNHTAQLFIKL